MLQRPVFFKNGRIALQRIWRVKETGAAAGRLFVLHSMVRAVGAEKKLFRSRRPGLANCKAIRLPLSDRKAVIMRTDAAFENSVAIKDKMMRRDGGGDIWAALADKGGCIRRRDMFEHHFERRKIFQQRCHHPLDK